MSLCVTACGRDSHSPKRDEEPVATQPTQTDPPKLPPAKADPERGLPSAADANAFILSTDAKLREVWTGASRAEWEKATNITDATEQAAAEANAKVMAFETAAIKEARGFRDVEADPPVKRQLKLLALTSTLPAPDDDAKRRELAELAAKMEGLYGKGKYCQDVDGKSVCRDLLQLSDVMSKSRSPGELLDVWTGWHAIAVPMKPMYARFVELGNEGARDLGFANMGELWRSRYDMTPLAFEQEIGRLWDQVSPLYEALHCHVRAKLVQLHGPEIVPPQGPIPAHLLGNMWAQEWTNLYPVLEPYPGEASLDVTAALQKRGYDPIEMVRLAESFFTSLGLAALPNTFWERSMFVKPADREVVCHASAWDVGMNNDLRIKMCIKTNHEDLVTLHHELGHDYYYNNYYTLPVLFQSGAHDGFHEAIGDAIALSITPKYLQQVGLLEEISENEKGVINKQMQDALGKIAFLPFGKLVDQWRWEVFAGTLAPDAYNAGWWRLRAAIQGVAAPTPRGEDLFDPGAKYHIPGNTPYARYFLAHILQFQFHKALCDAAGHEGPLHTCSIYGSHDAGRRLQGMLAMGASQPWPDALEALTGTREMDGQALVEYFSPLMRYLEQQNVGMTCGWTK